jgi:hypothetical protein
MRDMTLSVNSDGHMMMHVVLARSRVGYKYTTQNAQHTIDVNSTIEILSEQPVLG